MATRGRLVDVSALAGYVAEDAEEWLGYAAYELEGPSMEIVILEALTERQGVAGALIAACVHDAQTAGARRLWLITTNDNLTALRFYQRRGFVLVAVHRNAVTQARQSLKPEIGETGEHGIPIRDEIELELPHAIWPDFIKRYGWPHS